MMAKLVISCLIAGFTNQLSALERTGQDHMLKFKDGKITVVDEEATKIPIKGVTIDSEIDGSTFNLQETTFEIQHTSDSIYTCTLRDKPFALAIKFNTTTSCEKKP